jgi:hypothetical protein
MLHLHPTIHPGGGEALRRDAERGRAGRESENRQAGRERIGRKGENRRRGNMQREYRQGRGEDRQRLYRQRDR